MKEYNKALLEASQKFKSIVKDSHQTRGGEKIPYASLHAVVNAIQESLLKQEVRTETHTKRRKDDWFDVITTVVHIPSNESKKFHYETKLKDPTNNQERGAALTYGRRYNLLAAFNLTIDKDADDTDGHVEEVDEKKILAGIQAEDIQLLVDLTNELNAAASLKELQAAWNEKQKERDQMSPITQALLVTKKEQLKKVAIQKPKAAKQKEDVKSAA